MVSPKEEEHDNDDEASEKSSSLLGGQFTMMMTFTFLSTAVFQWTPMVFGGPWHRLRRVFGDGRTDEVKCRFFLRVGKSGASEIAWQKSLNLFWIWRRRRPDATLNSGCS
jgi:hypothetical protein